MPFRQAIITCFLAAILAALAVVAPGASALDTQGLSAPVDSALQDALPQEPSPSLSGYFIGAWFDWTDGQGAAYSSQGRLGGFEASTAPFGTRGLLGLSFGGGYSFQVLNSGTLGFYGALNVARLASENPGEPPALFGYSRSTPFRTRLGGRYSHVFSERTRGYFGVGWDYGFGGMGNYGARNPRIPLFGLASGTGAFAELGLKISANDVFSFDISTYGLSSGDFGDNVGGMNMVFSF
ncbi:MAG: hypothetical protein LBR80_13470 [Deltaproteobacteria bacterium]|jgi:hypothetical protein|nr:hypothetical protein [Deltaproteobacteria bacterium]